MKGSKSASGGVDSLPGRDRIVVVSENRRNMAVMSDALTGYAVTTVTSPEQLNPVLSGARGAELVVVDTDTVSDDVTALVETLFDEALSVVLLAEEPSLQLQRAAGETERLTFRQKPLRTTDLRTVVGERLR
jgi:hypothetical protein